MNATLYDTKNILPQDRTAFYPADGELLTGTWARRVAQQQVRALGWAGSIVLNPNNESSAGFFEYSATISLPDKAFTVNSPPMVFGMVRYGSVIIYKQFQDQNHSFMFPVNPLANAYIAQAQAPIFRTWIDDLHSDSITGGVRWSFTLRHRMALGNFPLAGEWKFVAPYTQMNKAWLPSLQEASQIILYWYAIGMQ